MIPRRLSQHDPIEATYARLQRVDHPIPRWEAWHATALEPEAFPAARIARGLSHDALKNLRTEGEAGPKGG